jgi:predicted acylesterase/phospholipase RssA
MEDHGPLFSRPTALILSGGAALGSWQAGCLYALAQKGMTFHSVFGTSIGALNGAGYFQDTLERMWKVWRHLDRGKFFRLRPGLSPIHVFSQKHLRRYLAEQIDEERAKRLKRCWFYVLSTDIASGTTHQAAYGPGEGDPWDGPLLDHVLGSISIPFVLPPVKIEVPGAPTRLLLDGNTKSFINFFPALQRGVKDLLFLNVVHPEDMRTPLFGLRSYITTLINQLLQGQIDHSLESLRVYTKDVRAYVFHPQKALRLKPLLFQAGPCREAFDQGLSDADALLATPEAWRVL